jgi:uncharacterized integral membrane protein
MQVFYWLILLMVIGLVIFFIQNAPAPTLSLRFLAWQVETSLIYTLLGAIGWGVFIIFFLWIPTAIRGSLRTRHLKKEIEFLKGERKVPEDEKPKES